MAGLNYVTFNQDHSLLAVATTRGLRTYTTEPFELSHASTDDDVSLVEPLFSTSLVAQILTPRLLRIINTKRHSTICELTFHGMVVAVKMNRKRLAVLLEEVAFVYDISNMRSLHQQNTPLNPHGICALSPSSENNYLAVPHHQERAASPENAPMHVPKGPAAKEPVCGDVLIYDLNQMEEVAVIPAHQTPLSCVAMNGEGTLLATASEKGTVIRIFSIPDGKKLFQFRRGSMPARIYCMSFNATSTLLCVSSATETVHVFRLAPPCPPPPPSAAAAGTTTPSPPPSPRHRALTAPAREPSLSPATSASDDPGARPADPASSPPASRQPRQPGFMSFVRRTSQNFVAAGLVTRAAGYLPASVTEMWEPQRDFAWMRIPRGAGGAPVRSVVAMASRAPHVLVATNEGDFYVYTIDLERGGEGTLVKRYEYVEKTGEGGGSAAPDG